MQAYDFYKDDLLLIKLKGLASGHYCLCFSDVGGAADKISLIPQDFFAELVSRTVRGIWKGFRHADFSKPPSAHCFLHVAEWNLCMYDVGLHEIDQSYQSRVMAKCLFSLLKILKVLVLFVVLVRYRAR